jgi:hypothetical protein
MIVNSQAYVRMGKDELAQRRVKCVAVDAVTRAQDQVRRRTVPA